MSPPTRPSLGALRLALGPYLSDLVRLVPEVAPDHEPGPPDPLLGRSRLLEALARAVEQLGGGGAGFHVIFDDLHWADAGTVELVSFLASRRNRHMLAAYRSHEAPAQLQQTVGGLRAAGMAVTVELGPLDVPAVEDLVRGLAGGAEQPGDLGSWLHPQQRRQPTVRARGPQAPVRTGATSAPKTAAGGADPPPSAPRPTAPGFRRSSPS